jgi:hypothetical protein
MRFLLPFLILFTTPAYAQDFIVIVNMNSPLKDADMEVIKEVYLGEKKFAGSTRFLPVNFTEGPIKESFLKEVLGMSPREYKHHCLKKVFNEGLTFPSMRSPVDIAKFVRKEKGAVAYLPASWARIIRSWNQNGPEDIKIIGP